MKRFVGVHTGEIMSGKGETVLTSDSNNACLVIVAYDAAKKMSEVVHNLGVARVEVILKVDSRKDKQKNMQDKIDSVKKYLEK